MRRKHDAGGEDRLRTLLRRGDPAADAAQGVPGPTAASLRARIVAAASERPRHAFAPFAWATATAAGLLLLLAIAVRPEGPAPPSPALRPDGPLVADAHPASPPSGPGIAVEPAPVVPLPPLPSVPPDEMEMRGMGPGPEPTPVTGSPSGTPDAASLAAAAPPVPSTPAAPSTRTPLTVQFTTPAGTRIIWTLDPEFSG
jgi:hypothetical protein